MPSLLIALAIGNGTGPELTAIFEQVTRSLAAPYDLTINFIRSPRIYHSYFSIITVNGTNAVTDDTIKDANHYQQFCQDVVAKGACAIFRTAVSAQALYLVRDALQAIKIENFTTNTSASVLLVRDQAQGFYSRINKVNATNNRVSRTVHFSKDIFSRILSFALTRARTLWVDMDGVTVTMVYKFHLFDGLFHSWAEEWQSLYSVPIRFIQGDTMNRNLLAFGLDGRHLLIAANEYADIMETILLDRFGLGAQETAYAENVYLHPALHCLSEYQTVHGSADDLMHKGIVNPSATIRAAAAILERNGPCPDLQAQVDATLKGLLANKIATPDQGGSSTTTTFVADFLQAIKNPLAICNNNAALLPDPSQLFFGKRSAVVVMDFQNDFVTSAPDQKAMECVAANISRVVDYSRNFGVEVMFVQFLGDEVYQPPTWRGRNQAQGQAPRCLEGSWGAKLFGNIAARDKEQVFKKKAHYDPFLSAEFRQYVTHQNIEHLVVIGLYADICVDATVRGAFQRGLWTTVVSDCTVTLHLPMEQILEYMHKVYGSVIVSASQLYWKT